MTTPRELRREDILPVEAFEKIRKERRREISAVKKARRVSVGPSATFYFENYDTMWWQIHEMLYIEKGGEAQIADELAAYNPLIPKGNELVATLMFEIENPEQRRQFLATLGGVERAVFLRAGGEEIAARPEADVERSTEGGRASSVHFLRFPFTRAAIAAFRDPAAEVVLGIGHKAYAHMAIVPENVRAALSEDFDGAA